MSARLLYRPGEGQPLASLPVGISSAIKLPNGEAVGEVNAAAYIRAEGIAASANVDYDLRALTDSCEGGCAQPWPEGGLRAHGQAP